MTGGLVVVPSAPVLIGLAEDEAHRNAMLSADLAITDSGLMVLVWRLMRREKLVRVSGLEYLRVFLKDPVVREPGNVAWIMPTPAARDKNMAWLAASGFPVGPDDCYLAPMYPAGKLNDPALLAWLIKRKPKHIIVGLGGGTQERLGHFLRDNLPYRPGIHCIGAAIGFLSGEQVNIPVWADYLFLGWLFRCLYEPAKFVPRYWRAKKLVSIMLRNGENLPPLAVKK